MFGIFDCGVSVERNSTTQKLTGIIKITSLQKSPDFRFSDHDKAALHFICCAVSSALAASQSLVPIALLTSVWSFTRTLSEALKDDAVTPDALRPLKRILHTFFPSGSEDIFEGENTTAVISGLEKLSASYTADNASNISGETILFREQNLNLAQLVSSMLSTGLLAVPPRAFISEKTLNDTIRARLSAALGLIMFTTQANTATSIEALGAIVRETMPIILNVRTALLLQLEVVDAERAGALGLVDLAAEGNGSPPVAYPVFRVLLPTDKKGGVDQSETASQQQSTVSYLSAVQLSKLPMYQEVISNPQSLPSESKIVITYPGKESIFGALVCFPTVDNVSADRAGGTGDGGGSAKIPQQSPWLGLTDILLEAVCSTISSCASKFEVASTILSVKGALGELESLQSENKRLKEKEEEEEKKRLEKEISSQILKSDLDKAGRYIRCFDLLSERMSNF